jgi:hypothetical protein
MHDTNDNLPTTATPISAELTPAIETRLAEHAVSVAGGDLHTAPELDPIFIWVCVDCLHTAANGEPVSAPEELDREPLSEIDHGAYEVFPGGEHEEDCYLTDDCECAVIQFSPLWCDGCGSNLAGERHALTLLPRKPRRNK